MILSTLSNMSKLQTEAPGDYIEDGLLYCGKCNTRKQTIIHFGGNEMKVPCMCECRTKEVAEERKAMQQAERNMYISNLRNEGIQDRSLRDKTFANDDGSNPRAYNTISRYCSKWEQIKTENIGLLLWGDVGTGKTFYACCVANHLIDKGIPVMVTNFNKIVNLLGKYYGEDKNKIIDDMNHYDLLVIDDLGVERQTDYMQEQVYNIIDGRYKAGKPIIITTNLTLEEIKNPSDMRLKRIYDRVQEMCVPVKFEGQSRRQAEYSKKIDRMKALLKEE